MPKRYAITCMANRRSVRCAILCPTPSERTINDEFLALEAFEARNTDGITPVAGADEFLRQLVRLQVPWAIVTSGSLKVASARIKQAGFPNPPMLVTSEDVRHGKPHPEPFAIGAARLNLSPARCLAFEDSTAGLLSATEAGCVVVEVLTRQSMVHDIDTWQTVDHYLDLRVMRKGEADFSLRCKEGVCYVIRKTLANAIRMLSVDAVQRANSGHPGAPMGMADIAEVLWRDFS
ncbi:Phosphatase YfbT [Raoultella terrigena]|uniref:Phosphatase YfbT n=1 Tax=Raoultella terrigena TaxID=577 RepID=A0A3P8M0F0_RAOTE|nr:Phosphatase YfbT [Raoultella terrigena]